MSWAAPDDVFLSTSLASYLDTNVVLEGACERLIVGDLYCDIPLGLCVIRGECGLNWRAGFGERGSSIQYYACVNRKEELKGRKGMLRNNEKKNRIP